MDLSQPPESAGPAQAPHAAALWPDAGMAAAMHAEQVRIAHGGTPVRIPSTVYPNFAVALVLIGALWNHGDRTLLLGWFLVEAGYQVLRVVLYHRYWQDRFHDERAPLWGAVFATLATTNGLIWGSAGVLFFLPGAPGQQDVLIVILCGMAAGTISVNSILLPALYGSAGGMLVPLIARSAFEGLQGDGLHLLVAFLLALYLGYVIVTGRHIHRTLLESIHGRIEKDDLIRELRLSQRDAEQANQSKSRFLAAASHDLRQPLHALTLFVGALPSTRNKEESDRIVANISASVAALDQLFNRLLDISRLDAGVVQPNEIDFPLQQLFDRVRNDLEPMALRKRLRMTVRDTAAAVRTDPLLLEQMLRNLVSNAIRYTDSGGILLACRRDGNGWRIEVRDSGCGIPASQQQRVFEEFYQVGNPERDSEKGLGLGLAIVARLADLIGCPVGLASTPGRGSIFSIAVPRGVLANGGRSTTSVDPVGLSGLRVLVVDDDRQTRDAMHTLLGQWDCDVREAESLVDAAGIATDRAWMPEAVISDYRLRDGESGIQVLDWMREHFGAELPCLLITGDIAVDRLREVRSRGYPILHKPLAPARIRNFLAAAQAAGEPMTGVEHA